MGESSHVLVTMGVSRKTPRVTKEDKASPTGSTETVFITGVIEAHKGRMIACFDIPGAYLHADCTGDGDKFMLLKGQLAEILVLVEPKL